VVSHKPAVEAYEGPDGIIQGEEPGGVGAKGGSVPDRAKAKVGTPAAGAGGLGLSVRHLDPQGLTVKWTGNNVMVFGGRGLVNENERL
jgi:hypothetical protein